MAGDPERPAIGRENSGRATPVGLGRENPTSSGDRVGARDLRADSLDLEELGDHQDHAEGADDLLRRYAPRPATPPPMIWFG